MEIIKNKIRWNEEKNELLKKTRGVGFQDIIALIDTDNYLGITPHPNIAQYPHQYALLFRVNGYIHYIPYVTDGEMIFLKTIIPSRKLHKKYS